MQKDKACFASIIVPVYNAEKWLQECIDSVLGQSDPDFELLLIDDGSSDQSAAIIDACAAEHPEQVRAVHQPNQGIGKARNKGLEMARGEFLLFADADDVVHPQLIEMLKKACLEMPADLYVWGYHEFEESMHFSPVEQTDFVPCSKAELLPRICRRNGDLCGFVWNKAFKRSLVYGICFDEDLRMLEDMLYLCRCIAAPGTQYFCDLKLPLYGYRQHAQSVTHRAFSGKQLTVLSAQDRMIQLLERGDEAERAEAAFLTQVFPWHVCMMNKKLLFHRKVAQRSDHFRAIDEYWKNYSRYARPASWPIKEKCYYLLQLISFRLRRIMK